MNSISWLLIETWINECDVVDPPRDTEGIEVSHYLLQVDSGSGMFCMLRLFVLCASFAAFLTLLVGRQEGYPAYKKSHLMVPCALYFGVLRLIQSNLWKNRSVKWKQKVRVSWSPDCTVYNV